MQCKANGSPMCHTSGHSDNFLPVQMNGKPNELVRVKLISNRAEGLYV